MRRTLSILLCVLLTLSPVAGITSGSSFLQNPDAIEEAINSVLFIAIFDENNEITATGSGFVAFNNRTIVTNHHVIEGADSIWASDEAENIYEIDRILAMDEEKDIAILLIKSATNLTPLKLADISVLKRGQPVMAIGSPEGYVNTVSNGIISALYDRNDTPDIQFTAPVSHGSSGGALFNETGEVIGVTSATDEEGQNLNFAIGIYHVIDLYRRYNPGYDAGKQTVTNVPFKPTTTPAPTPNPISMTELPTPDGLSVKTIGRMVSLTWIEAKGALGYRVYRSASANGTYDFIGGTSMTPFFDENVLEGETYFYKVASSDGKTTSDMSAFVSLAIPKSTSTPMPTVSPTLKPIPKPTLTPTPKPTLTPTLSPTPAPISYVTQEEAAKYKSLTIGASDPDVARLKKRMYELGYSSSKTGNNNFTEKTVEYVKEFQRVNGLPADGIALPIMQALLFSDHANPKPTPTPKPSPTPKPTPRLSKPTNVKAKVSGTTVTITWTTIKGATQYKIYRSIQPKGAYSFIATASTNKCIDGTAIRGYTYYYKVESITGLNVSGPSNYVKAVMPKPTPTPYIEPKYPIVIGDTGYTGTSRDPFLNPKIVSVSKRKIVDGFTLAYMCKDVYGEILKYDDTSDQSAYTYTKTIKPGQSLYPGKVSMTNRDGNVKYIYVAIIKIHTTDGNTYYIPESEWKFDYWTLD